MYFIVNSLNSELLTNLKFQFSYKFCKIIENHYFPSDFLQSYNSYCMKKIFLEFLCFHEFFKNF